MGNSSLFYGAIGEHDAELQTWEPAGAFGSSFGSNKGISVGSLEKVECLGSGADAKAAASVPDVCPDCVRGE